MNIFKKRVFTPTSFIKYFGLFGLYLPVIIRSYMRPKTSTALREKIMLAVTSVNDCRYCSWAHSHLALQSGVDLEEVNAILEFNGYKADKQDEAAAILYAQTFADNGGKPDAEALNELKKYFSAAQIREIHGYIYTIYIGNYSGNTFDALLSRFKGIKVEGSNVLFETFCAFLTAPVLISIYLKSRGDKRVVMESL